MNREDFSAKYVNIRANDKMRGNPSKIVPSPKVWFYEEEQQIKKHFKLLIVQLQNILDQQLEGYDEYIKDKSEYPFPVILELADDKIAKSHRPAVILNRINSEIIAIQEIGEIIIGASKSSLEDFIQLIYDALEEVPRNRRDWLVIKDDKEGVTKSKAKWYEIIHQLTCIKSIQLYTHESVTEGITETSLEYIKKDKEFKIRFFNYGNADVNEMVFGAFLKNLKRFGIKRNRIKKLNFINSIDVYAIPYVNDEILKAASSFPGVESISSFVYFESGSQEMFVEDEVIEAIQPTEGQNYPVVAVVDSGISPNNYHLRSWIADEDPYVIPSNQDNYHGNFVVGMMNYGHLVNPTLTNIVDTGVKVLDVTVLPDPEKEKVREDDLLASLEQALEDHSSQYKVWNLSLSSNRMCSGIVSEFTAAIDELQKKHNVLFVIATGNASNEEERRVTLPGDSVRGVTVGAIALESSSHAAVEQNMIVPYSRKGPGIGLSIKPDVVHYSGNPLENPIYSINEQGKKIGDFGTSFSTPIVSALLAEYYSLYPGQMNPMMAKALLVHGASHPQNNKRVNEISEHYECGYGIPKRISQVLHGDEHEITLILEGEIDSSQGTNWIKIEEFPFPDSLVNDEFGKIRGNILVTMVYDTPLLARFGSEYCRCNLDIRIRTKVGSSYDKITKGSKTDIDFVEKWERDRMTNEHKWSNVKQVEFKSPAGRKGTGELILEVLPNWRNLDEKVKIPFVIAVTIKDPKKEAPVYNEVTRQLNATFATTDVRLKNAPIRLNIH